MPQKTSVVQDIEETLTIEAKKIGAHFQKIDETSLKVLHFLEQELGKGTKTYGQWNLIATSIQSVAKSVREISSEGQAHVDDVLSSFRDYMCFSEENVTLKAEEIQGYKANLDSLGARTRNIVLNVFSVLEKTQVKIVEFTSHWPKGNTQYSKDIKPRILEVQNSIKSIQLSIEQLQACQNRISNTGVHPLSYHNSRIKIVRSLSLLLPEQTKGHLHTFLKGINNPEVEEAQAEVDDQIFNSLGTLINVGQMLSFDITELQLQFNEYSARRDLGAFKARFDSIRSLYGCLPNVLREFNKACFTPGKGEKQKPASERKPSLLKKILRLFGVK